MTKIRSRKRRWPLFEVKLLDEVPRIGSGQRVVEAEIGRKWVRVRKHPDQLASRISLAVWSALNPEPVIDRRGRTKRPAKV
jgi:hypothetical protein